MHRDTHHLFSNLTQGLADHITETHAQEQEELRQNLQRQENKLRDMQQVFETFKADRQKLRDSLVSIFDDFSKLQDTAFDELLQLQLHEVGLVSQALEDTQLQPQTRKA